MLKERKKAVIKGSSKLSTSIQLKFLLKRIKNQRSNIESFCKFHIFQNLKNQVFLDLKLVFHFSKLNTLTRSIILKIQNPIKNS